LNISLYIAKKIFGGKSNTKTISNPIVNIGITGIALGVAVMIITLSVITGFQKQIIEKITTFSSHMQLHDYNKTQSEEPFPISVDKNVITALKQYPDLKHIQPFATKNGVLKTKTDNEGIILKGVDENYDWSFIKPYIIKGELPKFNYQEVSKDIFISQALANKLNIELNQKLLIYFMTKKKTIDSSLYSQTFVEYEPRVKDFYVKGIFNTGFSDFDKNLAFVDLQQIQKLNYWTTEQVAGYEIYIKDFNNLELISEELNEIVGFNYKISTVKELQNAIFSWLDMINVNAVIIITLMVLVAAINMISALLILILERTSFVGILKALGFSNSKVRSVFFYVSLKLLAKGLLFGNIIGIGFCLLQHHFKLIALDSEIYYLSFVPINLTLIHVILINVGTIITCLLMMFLPTLILNKITPLKAIRFS